MKTVITLCTLILLLMVACYRDSGSVANAPKNFKLKSLTSSSSYELKNFKGSPLILNFWASWCRPCKEEMPLFESQWKQHKNSGLAMVGINVMDTEKEALNILKQLNITYINLSDANDEASTSYNILALPVTYFINRDGKIHHIEYGPFHGKSGEKVLRTKLKEILQ